MSLNMIFMYDTTVIAATSSGVRSLDVISGDTNFEVPINGGCSSIWSDGFYTFIGSNDSGVLWFANSMYGALYNYASEPFLSSNTVRYIHGNSDTVVCCTSLGVDILRRASMYNTKTYVYGASKCAACQLDNVYYYLTNNEDSSYSINKLNSNTSDWGEADVIYTTGSGFLSSVNVINDICVSEYTSSSTVGNTLFIATGEGFMVYDEDTSDYYFDDMTAYGVNTNIVSIKCDPDTSLNYGNVYLASSGIDACVMTFSMVDKSVKDLYRTDLVGNIGKQLDSDDIVNICASR